MSRKLGCFCKWILPLGCCSGLEVLMHKQLLHLLNHKSLNYGHKQQKLVSSIGCPVSPLEILKGEDSGHMLVFDPS